MDLPELNEARLEVSSVGTRRSLPPEMKSQLAYSSSRQRYLCPQDRRPSHDQDGDHEQRPSAERRILCRP